MPADYSKVNALIESGADWQQVVDETDAYCPLLWSHLHVSAIGDVLPCCVGDWNRPLGNINNQTFDEIWNGEEMRKLRLRMREDKKVPHCQACYSKESSGTWSLRTDSVRKYHQPSKQWVLNTAEDGTSTDSKPIYWDIRFSNICNMRCKMCGHFSSSRWFNDAKELAEQHEEYRYKTQRNQAIVHGVEDSTALLDRLDEYLPYVQELYFAGGEPMIMEEHYRILKRLDELELYNVYLRYSTNFMQMHYKDMDVIKTWSKFKNVYCAASIDAEGARAENIRKDTVWPTIEKHVKRVKEEAPHVKFGIAPTLQIMSVFTICDLHKKWIKREWLKPNDMFFNILENPSFYNLKALPPHMKQDAEQVLRDHIQWLSDAFPDYHLNPVIDTINNTIGFMNSEQLDESVLRDMVNQTKLIDQLRNEDTPSTFPELEYIWTNYA